MKYSNYTKWLLLLSCWTAIMISCDDDDPKKDITSSDCCNGIYQDTSSSFILYWPTAYTPNGDGLNDKFILWADTSLGVQAVTGFVAMTESGDTLFTKDTMFYQEKGMLPVWDITGRNSSLYYGRVICYFNLTDALGDPHPIRAAFCSKSCFSEKDLQNSKENKCLFPDQLDPVVGFIFPTQEKLCP